MPSSALTSTPVFKDLDLCCVRTHITIHRLAAWPDVLIPVTALPFVSTHQASNVFIVGLSLATRVDVAWSSCSRRISKADILSPEALTGLTPSMGNHTSQHQEPLQVFRYFESA